MFHEIKVLDHGLIRLIDSMGSDLSIVRNARVSYNASWRTGTDSGSDNNLIKYLLKNGHNTPFESVTATFEIKAPIFVFRQWHRHRTQSYNELSARYKELPEEFYIPELNKITTQSTDNKQMRTDTKNMQAESIRRDIINQNTEAFECYRSMLGAGCPREIARSVLPLGTYSHMFATANLWNWMRFLKERQHEHAQYEIRVYANAIANILKYIAPTAMLTYEAMKNDE